MGYLLVWMGWIEGIFEIWNIWQAGD